MSTADILRAMLFLAAVLYIGHLGRRDPMVTWIMGLCLAIITWLFIPAIRPSGMQALAIMSSTCLLLELNTRFDKGGNSDY